jgi:hypothetical protein
VAGAEIVIEYVDPRWDLTRAGQLASWGVPENALVFERQRRKIVVTLDEMLSKPSALRENAPARAGRRGVGGRLPGRDGLRLRGGAPVVAVRALDRVLAAGHGEARFDDYDELKGFSDIARDVKRNGFEIRPLTLSGLSQIPSDCHVLVVAGARYELAAEEIGLIEAFLQRGGRLMCLERPRVTTGLEPVLEKWGIRLTPFVATSSKTLSGQDVVVSSFADHVITRSLANTSVVFGSPLCWRRCQRRLDPVPPTGPR